MIHSEVIRIACQFCNQELRGFVERHEQLKEYFTLEFESDCTCDFDKVQGHGDAQSKIMDEGITSLKRREENLPFFQRLGFLVNMFWYKRFTIPKRVRQGELKRIREAIEQVEEAIAREKREAKVAEIFAKN